jgi:hypothetical protein
LAQEAKRRGARLIAIDPCRTATADKCDQHIALLPGTDSALALGLMHVLIRDELLDHDYIAQHTLGFDALKARALHYPPARVAAICGIDASEVEQLAREYGSTTPAAIRTNYGINRTAGGGMALRTLACLPALTGAWRHPAGGILLSSSGNYPVDSAALERPDLMPSPTPRMINMSTIGQDLLRARPPIKALFVYNSNPVAIAPQSGEVVRGFARDDLFTVVHDLFQTDTADYADILLPATSHMEQLDIHKSYGHLHIQVNQPAIAPLGEAVSNTELFRRLASAMAFSEACFADSDEDLCRQAFDWKDPRLAGLSWEKLKADGHARLNLPRGHRALRQRRLPNALRKMRVLQHGAGQRRRRPLAGLHRPARMAAESAGQRVSAGPDHPAGAQLPEHQLCQLGAFPGPGKVAGDPSASGRRGGKDFAHRSTRRQLLPDRARDRPCRALDQPDRIPHGRSDHPARTHRSPPARRSCSRADLQQRARLGRAEPQAAQGSQRGRHRDPRARWRQQAGALPLQDDDGGRQGAFVFTFNPTRENLHYARDFGIEVFNPAVAGEINRLFAPTGTTGLSNPTMNRPCWSAPSTAGRR